MAMFVQITRCVPRMIVALAGFFLLPGLIAVIVLVDIAGLVPWVVVVFAGFFVGHLGSPRVGSNRSAANIMRMGLISPLRKLRSHRKILIHEPKGSTRYRVPDLRLSHPAMPCINREAIPYSQTIDHVRRVQITVGGLWDVLTAARILIASSSA